MTLEPQFLRFVYNCLDRIEDQDGFGRPLGLDPDAAIVTDAHIELDLRAQLFQEVVVFLPKKLETAVPDWHLGDEPALKVGEEGIATVPSFLVERIDASQLHLPKLVSRENATVDHRPVREARLLFLRGVLELETVETRERVGADVYGEKLRPYL